MATTIRTAVLDCSALMRFLLGDGPVDERIIGAFREVDRGRLVLLAPDLLHLEAAQVLRNRVVQGALSSEDASELLGDILSIPLRLTAHRELLPAALEVALASGIAIYDAAYLELARLRGADLLTCDGKMERAWRML